MAELQPPNVQAYIGGECESFGKAENFAVFGGHHSKFGPA
jgi:hypothetical protein